MARLFASMPIRTVNCTPMNALITIDSEILGGTPVFSGTRVPVQTLFDYLERDYPLAAFLECFPTVSHETACAVLDRSKAVLLAKSVE